MQKRSATRLPRSKKSLEYKKEWSGATEQHRKEKKKRHQSSKSKSKQARGTKRSVQKQRAPVIKKQENTKKKQQNQTKTNNDKELPIVCVELANVACQAHGYMKQEREKKSRVYIYKRKNGFLMIFIFFFIFYDVCFLFFRESKKMDEEKKNLMFCFFSSSIHDPWKGGYVKARSPKHSLQGKDFLLSTSLSQSCLRRRWDSETMARF